MEDLSVDVVKLSMRFGEEEPLFSELSFKIQKGEFAMIIGPNGCGKTTLIKIIMGLYKSTGGHVHVHERSIGYVPQYLQKDEFSPMSVRELFSLKLKDSGFWWGMKKCEKKVLEMLARTNIEYVYDRQIRNLSGGEFQRVMISYALIDDPGLLILDEPISGIDIHGEQEFFELLERIHSENPVTIIMISHDLDVVYKYASQVICLNKDLLCQGVPEEVLTKETIEKTFTTKHGVYHHQPPAHKKGKKHHK